MSQEKSQLENITLPPQDGEATQTPQKASSALPDGFSLGEQLTDEAKPALKSEAIKYSLPNYSGKLNRIDQEERDLRARLEKQGMNYDLHVLIREKLVEEFTNGLENKGNIENDESTANSFRGIKNIILKQFSLPDFISENPGIYTPTAKDLLYISQNLREFFGNIKENDYPQLGVFLNSFIHAYFDSVPEEKRKDLKLFLPNTNGLNFLGADLSFGELEVEEVGDYFGWGTHGNTILKAKKAGNSAGLAMHGEASLEVGDAGDYFGDEAHGSATLKARKVEYFAGHKMHENAKLEVEEAVLCFGQEAYGSTILKAKKVGASAGLRAHGEAKMEVIEASDYFGSNAYESAVLKAKRVKNNAGVSIHGNASLEVEEAGERLGSNAYESAVLKAKKTGNKAGFEMRDKTILEVEEAGEDVGELIKEDAKIIITKSYSSIGKLREGNSQIILPNKQILRSGKIKTILGNKLGRIFKK